MSTYGSPYQAYKDSSVLSASPEQLVVMLYDGALRFLTRAAMAMRAGQAPAAGIPLRRAQAIIDELLATLDLSAGELAERLQSIYVFCTRLLVEAQLEADPEKLDKVCELLRELREAWAEIAAGGVAQATA